MLRLGVWMAILGFGSLFLEKADMHFIILAWADNMQPGFGIVLGAIGVLVALVAVGMQAKDKQA
ncbi:hypothetical protein KHQ06_07650 [Nocardia tengchongensis]|uniref:Uncharacterized protein n=1 Tax=Nocardia tengchongensis TaxID=2055889 RepID=A0ABX8CTH8_9NOCA|nr:hypothetical protein [Nocardia tengchongensis]QVI22844.1 hypothetical protein KHQ06_07650 [Nocardia tengchongensis]